MFCYILVCSVFRFRRFIFGSTYHFVHVELSLVEFSLEDSINDRFGHIYPDKTESSDEEIHTNTAPNVVLTEIVFAVIRSVQCSMFTMSCLEGNKKKEDFHSSKH